MCFFGFMFADLGYGLLLAPGLYADPGEGEARRGFGQLIRRMTMCGISSAVIGFYRRLLFPISWPSLPACWGCPSRSSPSLRPEGSGARTGAGRDERPHDGPGFSLAVGLVQIIVGMAVKFWLLCRDGQVWDAIWDVGTWWVIFAGIGLFALNMTGISAVGSVNGIPVVLIIGCLMLLAQGRSAKGFGKVTAIIGAVYNGVTGYFGDILLLLPPDGNDAGRLRSSARCSTS